MIPVARASLPFCQECFDPASLTYIFTFTLRNLPAPIHPDANDIAEREPHGSLSDFSDYESSDEGQSQPRASTSTATSYGTRAYNQYQQQPTVDTSKNALIDLDDPFADPGEQEVGTPGIAPRKQYVY